MAHIDAAPSAEGVRLRACDLRDATRKAAAIRAAAGDRDAPVYLDIEVLIERDTAQAFSALAALPEQQSRSPRPLRYIGTPRGLASLIADAVVLLPLGSSRVVELMLDELAPGLGRIAATT